jgi:hypothetical protein
VIFNHQVAPGRHAAVRAGWNDAAWGLPRREVGTPEAYWYERGYAGGLVFCQKQQSDLSERVSRFEHLAASRAGGVSQSQ